MAANTHLACALPPLVSLLPLPHYRPVVPQTLLVRVVCASCIQGGAGAACPHGAVAAGGCVSRGGTCFSASLAPYNAARPALRRGVSRAAEVDVPPIDGDLPEVMEDAGAEVNEHGVALTFHNDDQALLALSDSVTVYNMSHFGRFRVSGDDRIRFLHNLSTADFQSRVPGQGCHTVFVTPTARTLDLSLALIMNSAVVLTVSPSQRVSLLRMMDRYIFPADKVDVDDITDKTCQLAIIGPRCHEIVANFGVTGLHNSAVGDHKHFSVDGSPATLVVGSGLATPGYTLLLSTDIAGKVWADLVASGVVPMGEAAWNRARVLQGRPAPGAELTSEYNPLEAGLWHSISTTKGCYMGQETIARLITYDGVKQSLWGVRLPCQLETPVDIRDPEGIKVGKLTSCVQAPPTMGSPFFGLGYVRRSHSGEGKDVVVEGHTVVLCDVPFLARELDPAHQ